MRNLAIEAIESEQNSSADTASYAGIVAKTSYFVIVTMVFAVLTMIQLPNLTDGNGFIMVLIGAMVVGMIAGMVALRSPRHSAMAGTIYTACQGLFLGTLVTIVEQLVTGAGILALGITFAILISMLILYASGIVRNTPMVRKFTMILGLSVFIIMIGSLFMLLFNPGFFAGESGWYMMVGMSALILLFGVFMLIQDFDRMQSLVAGGFDKRFEWIAAIGLIMTLILIYTEVLRLIMLFAARRD